MVNKVSILTVHLIIFDETPGNTEWTLFWDRLLDFEAL